MFKYSYSIHTRKSGDGNRTSFAINLSVNSRRKDIPLGLSCLSIQWDKDKKMISDPLLNLRLQGYISDLHRLLMQYELSPTHTMPTLEEVIDTFNNTILHPSDFSVSNRRRTADVFSRFYEYESVRASWADNTCRQMKTTITFLESFRHNSYIDDIDDVFLTQYVQHYSNKWKASTLYKKLKNIRWFLRWASVNNLYNGNSHNTFKPKIKGANDITEIIYLTVEELQLLENHKWNNNQQHLERVTDCFLFSCFSGLRYSDIRQLRPWMMSNNTIHFTTKKTDTPLAIPLNNHTQRLWDKYEGHLPVISNQKSNAYIKESMRICGITSPVTNTYYRNGEKYTDHQAKCDAISFHDSRKTFVTLALSLGIPAEVIIQITGHKSINHLKPYLHVVQQLKEKEMSKFNTI